MIRNSTEQTSAICSFVTLRNVAPLLDSSQVRASCALATGGEIAQCYAGCNENFVLLTTGITGVLSFEL